MNSNLAKLVYDETGRLLFTKEMKKEFTILMPQMLPVHFAMLKRCFEMEGYNVDVLNTTHKAIVETGLKYVHNDTCYPALLVIGQLIEAVQSGRYDVDKIALLITQTGGGCRASNYIHLLRKALIKAGLDKVPVVSLNLSGLEKNPGFSLNLRLIRRLIAAVVYGDIIVNLSNQCRPYETKKGASDELIDYWVDRLVTSFSHVGALSYKNMKINMDKIVADFAKIKVEKVDKPKVGVVGEIYIKYAPLGNNNLEEFLLKEGAEPIVPGLMDFIIFKVNNRVVDVDIYGGAAIKKTIANVLQKYIERYQMALIDAIRKEPRFNAPPPFSHLQELIKGYLGYGNKMGEGWLLTAEMLELITSGVNNIVCTQPFGCLPNHVAGKGMIRKLKNDYPDSNIVSIDYDPGATKVNQENRIKLMLSNAKIGENLSHK